MDPGHQDELLIVGPAGHSTGGIARYIAQQQHYLPDDVTGTVYDIATPNGEGPLWFLGAVLRSLVLALRFPFRSRPDIVHVHTSHYFSFYLSAFYTLFTAYVWNRPVVLHTHGSSFDEFVMTESVPIRHLQSWVFGASDAIVVLSEYWYDIVVRRAPEEKLVVLPNTVTADEYTPAVDIDPPHVVFVSNHIQRKGIEEFVAAVRELSERPDLEFEVTICGKGPLSSLSVDLAATYDHVTYRGYVDEKTKREVLSHGSIYVLPTYAEGLPIALLEAMAAGNALVSTDVGGIPDLVGPENGLTVTPGDVPGLTAALDRLLRDPELVREMGRENRRLVTEQYSWVATNRRLDTLYGDLLGAERRG